MTQYDLSSPEGFYSVQAVRVEGGFKVTVGGRTFFLKIEPTGDPSVFVAQAADKPLNITLEEANGQRVVLVIDGERLTFGRPASSSGAHPARPAVTLVPKDTLPAPMPGRVIGIMAKVGERISTGDPLLIIESMKMETVIRSDRDAESIEVLVSEGSTIKRGQALVRFRA